MTCKACGATTRDPFCRRCWRLISPWDRYDLIWWAGQSHSGLTIADREEAHAAWWVIASAVTEALKPILAYRQGERIRRRHAPKRRAKTLAELATEAEANL